MLEKVVTSGDGFSTALNGSSSGSTGLSGHSTVQLQAGSADEVSMFKDTLQHCILRDRNANEMYIDGLIIAIM